MKTINLYFDFEFTSLSPDAQPISLGIVSEELIAVKYKEFTNGDKPELISAKDNTKSFYSEFSDFDINRCDDWVKENVVSKLKFAPSNEHFPAIEETKGSLEACSDTERVMGWLTKWLEQFSDYQIQFVCDCGTFDWYHLLQLIGNWEEKPWQYIIDAAQIPPNETIEDFISKWRSESVVIKNNLKDEIPCEVAASTRTGLPQLPSNISPVPSDLNDLLSFYHHITPAQAFDLNREELIGTQDMGALILDGTNLSEKEIEEISEAWNKADGPLIAPEKAKAIEIQADNKHNALWDAKVIKRIYEAKKIYKREKQ